MENKSEDKHINPRTQDIPRKLQLWGKPATLRAFYYFLQQKDFSSKFYSKGNSLFITGKQPINPPR